MPEASIVIGLTVALFALLVSWVIFGRGKRGTQTEDGRKMVSRAEVSHAEKEQMKEPQEEFVDDNPPSAKK